MCAGQPVSGSWTQSLCEFAGHDRGPLKSKIRLRLVSILDCTLFPGPAVNPTCPGSDLPGFAPCCFPSV